MINPVHACKDHQTLHAVVRYTDSITQTTHLRAQQHELLIQFNIKALSIQPLIPSPHNTNSFKLCAKNRELPVHPLQQQPVLHLKNLVLDPHVNRQQEEIEASQAPEQQSKHKHDNVRPVLAQLFTRLFCLRSQLQRRLAQLQVYFPSENITNDAKSR